MKKYYKILAILLRNSYIRDSKIPGFVISNMVFNLVEILFTIIFFNVIFNNTETLAGWNFYQILFLYMIAKFVSSFHGIFTKRGTNNMSHDLIRQGDLDLYLIKPADPMFMVSISRPQVYGVISIIFELMLAGYAIAHTGITIGALNIIWFIILMFLSIILFYYLRWITLIPVFWTIRLFSLRDIMSRLGQFMRYPAGVFPAMIKWALFVLFPIMIVSYIPARTIFYSPNILIIGYMFIITLVFAIFTKYLWNLGLRHYGSASS